MPLVLLTFPHSPRRPSFPRLRLRYILFICPIPTAPPVFPRVVRSFPPPPCLSFRPSFPGRASPSRRLADFFLPFPRLRYFFYTSFPSPAPGRSVHQPAAPSGPVHPRGPGRLERPPSLSLFSSFSSPFACSPSIYAPAPLFSPSPSFVSLSVSLRRSLRTRPSMRPPILVIFFPSHPPTPGVGVLLLSGRSLDYRPDHQH